MKPLLRMITHRITIVAFAMLLQLGILITVLIRFNRYFSSFYAIMVVFSAFVVIYIVNSKSNPAYKLAWIIPILIIPVFGGFFYYLFGNNTLSHKKKLAMQSVVTKSIDNARVHPDVSLMLEKDHPHASAQSKYIEKYSFCSPCAHTCSQYFSLGEHFFDALKQDLAQANDYIFMEYFIIEPGIMWDSILSILCERIQAGVKVRLIYDDIGCLMTLPKGYAAYLESLGIEIAIFNPLKLMMSSKYNTRDHRKITVIDGYIGYTGGCNLADEYINRIEKHGHWKDSAVRLEGDAVWHLAVMFLSLWDFIHGIDEDYTPFQPHATRQNDLEMTQGIVQPFTDNPLDDEPVGASIYLNMIYKAQEYVYIKTPYLIIDNEMFMALSIAAKSGIDVRIITPGVADKWYVHATTRSYYQMLIENGVKIYEYTPGFIHEKVVVADGQFAVIGTINLDYRSLYLHFECGVWLYQTPSVVDMQHDFEALLLSCQEITRDACSRIPGHVRLLRALLRFFAPLM